MQKANCVSNWKYGRQGFASYCTEVCWVWWALQCGWTARSPKNFRVTLKAFIFTWPHLPSPSIFRACHDSHHERTTFPENTSFAWNGRLWRQRVKEYWYGSYCLCVDLWIWTSGWWSTYCSGWFRSYWSRTWRKLWTQGRIFWCKLCWWEDDSLSLKIEWMISLHIHHLSYYSRDSYLLTSCHIGTWLCDTHKSSMFSTILEPLSAPTSAPPRTMTRDILGVVDLAPTSSTRSTVWIHLDKDISTPQHPLGSPAIRFRPRVPLAFFLGPSNTWKGHMGVGSGKGTPAPSPHVPPESPWQGAR